ncbi:MAG TPA: hypothetical protein PLY93_00215 [Turneriella sp.]|nr:hypothetical protein [Turneriella sp.]
MKKILSRIYYFSLFQFVIKGVILVVVLPFLIILIIISRYKRKPIQIGFGPEPLINNLYHKRALEEFGFTAETFVNQVYFITDEFDIRVDKLPFPINILSNYLLGFMVLWRYECLYIYYNGGPFAWTLLAKWEPLIYRFAKIKIHVTAYGGDVHDLRRVVNLNFKRALDNDYPMFYLQQVKTEKQVARWSKYGTHISSGCDWVYYVPHWHTLMLGHFCIDLAKIHFNSNESIPKKFNSKRPLRLFHAPNHKAIKGSNFFINAVKELREEGCAIELNLKQGVPNSEIQESIQDCDVVLDQLIIGWYAMFSIEAMSHGKPVVCYLSEELLEFYTVAGLITPHEVPIINASALNVKSIICDIYTGKIPLKNLGINGRKFVEKHHSLEVIGEKFAYINQLMDINPVVKK